MPTYRCPAECKHCGTLSSPREKGRLSFSDMIRAIDEAASIGYDTIVFTGGEPTLIGVDLNLAIEHAVSRGLGTRVVTNAHWAKTELSTDDRIRKLVKSGLNEINYSTGDQHVRFVPLENVLRGITSAARANLRVSVMVETTAERIVTRQSITEHPSMENLFSSFPNLRIDVQESPWMPLDPSEVQSYPEGMVTNLSNISAKNGCDSILTTTTVQADGRIAACCGLGMRILPELQLGNISSTLIAEADKIASNDFLKRWIRVEGPEKILAWAASINSEIVWEDMYAHRCQACVRLYTDMAVRETIAENYEDKIPDVLFGEWLLNHCSATESSTEDTCRK
jgi:organic radical activating enzyme